MFSKSFFKILLCLMFINSIPSVNIIAENLEDKLSEAGYVDLTSVVPDIKVKLMYAQAENFTGVVLYDGLTKAYLHPDAARALGKAQKILKSFFQDYNLLIKDAARPMSVQRKMFNAVKGTSKAKYVANPARGGGLHNYGLAVDITLVDSKGNELPMGTKVDHLGPEANIDKEQILVKQGIISETERQNRLLLRKVMLEAGFKTIRTEWWHFDFVNKKEAASRYKRLDF